MKLRTEEAELKKEPGTFTVAWEQQRATVSEQGRDK